MSSSRHFVLLPLLFFLLLSFECVLLAPNLFSKIVSFGESGDAFDSPSFADGTATDRFSATESDGRAMAKRNSRMVNALSTILNKRRELGTNDAFRVRIRSLDQMGNTNCYFSPVQCYFFEER
ncbi:hypothetical protein niasHS_002674 [Heterodera schachtii]|uniref:Uncharacterized protein n=1 Tax=Heterodera schachtii TaxID=97005 RepID=A0ABD2K2B2_HETSC